MSDDRPMTREEYLRMLDEDSAFWSRQPYARLLELRPDDPEAQRIIDELDGVEPDDGGGEDEGVTHDGGSGDVAGDTPE